MKEIYKNRPLFKNPRPPEGASKKEIYDWKRLEVERLTALVELPHLHGWKWYTWAAEFRDSTNPVNLLCAGNQLSKSSTQIRKCIIWATDQELWPNLWSQKPIQFWYLYPTKQQVNAEFETKWKQFLPKGTMKEDPYYGWKEIRSGGNVSGIKFNSGVYVFFKTYAQESSALQTGTCDAIFCDEELPVDIFDELVFRVSASSGYFHMVFTATLGQDFWRRAMEPEDGEEETLPQAHKQTVSLYDCMIYEDGTPSHWTPEKIKTVEARCSTANEILKRVHGKFIVLTGRKYESFDLKRHMKKKHPIPKSWLIYEGVDIGGGKGAHKAAICFVAVAPDFRSGRVFLGWRGDLITTTAGDVFLKHLELKKEHKLNINQKWYDWGNKDFGEIATRAGDAFEKADKSHEKGEEVINTLFKNDMLYIYEDPELIKLGAELASLKADTNKNWAKDDFCDALRYCVTKIPWDWSFITGAKSDFKDVAENPENRMTQAELDLKARRDAFRQDKDDEEQSIQDEFDEWNDQYG